MRRDHATPVGTPPHLPLLLDAVDEMRAYVVDRMRGRREGVEPVLQSIRETVWRRAAAYDANLGRPQDFVFGVTRNLLRKELAKAVPTHVELNEAALPTAAPDPLSSLLSRFDAHRWMRFVADAVGEDDWQRMVDLAFDDLGADAHSAEATRSIRTVRDRVALVASTVRAALMAADNGSAATLDIAACCVPDVAGLRTVLPLLDSSCDDIAARLGLHPGTVRSRVATVRRLLDIAMLVLRSEAI